MKKILRWLILFTILGGFAFVFFGAPRLILVRSVDCQSQFGPCSDHLETLAQMAKGKSLYLAKRQLNQKLASESLVDQFDLRFILPDKLAVVVVARKASFAITKTGSRNFALVDKDGVVIGFEEETPLPVLVIDELGDLGVGSRVSDEIIFAGEIMAGIFSAYTTRAGVVADENLRVKIQGIEVIFPLSGDREALLGSLALILSRLETPVSTIDLRFQNPVVR